MRKSIIILIIIGAILSLFILVGQPGNLGLMETTLSLTIIWVGIAPSIIYLGKISAESRIFPLMSLTGLFYAVFFGLSGLLAFSLKGTGSPGSDAEKIFFYQTVSIEAVSIEAQLIVLTGMLLMFGTWVIAWKIFPERKFIFCLPIPECQRGLILAGLILAMGSIVYFLFPSVRLIPSIGQFLQPAGYVAFSLFYLMYASKELPRLFILIYFLCLLPLWVTTIIATGFFTPLIMIVIIWIALRLVMIGNLPLKLIVSALILFAVLYSQKHLIRHQIWDVKATASTFEKVSAAVKILPDLFFDNSPKAIESGGSIFSGHFNHVELVRRISLILTLSHVVNLSPNVIPYWNGTTYQTLFSGMIPRALWREKPEERWGNAFGLRYKIIAKSDGAMSVNIPWLTELYTNFGWRGVIFGMILIGAFMGLLDRFFNAENTSITGKAVAAGLVLPLFYQESNFTVMTGSLIPQMLAMWLYFTVFMGGSTFLILKLRGIKSSYPKSEI